MKQHILLPTDFSDNSWYAIVYALRFYADKECTFYLLHTTKMNVSTMSNLSNKLTDIVNENAMTELEELKEQVERANANPNHKFEIILRSEDLEKAIKFVVNKYNISLVIMGTNGASGAKEFFFGSNTVKVIKRMNLCPVLTIPSTHDFVVPKQIAFPTDFNRFYDATELQPLKDLADVYNSKIRIVHINVEEKLNDVQEHNLTILKKYLEDYEHSLHWMPDYTKKAKEINVFIEDLEIDILVMINYRHSFLESIINEPVIKKIGFNPIVPFLIIPE